MQTKMTPADRLSELISNNNIPVTALFDVKSRMNEWLEQANCDLNKEIEAAYERIHRLTIKIEEMF